VGVHQAARVGFGTARSAAAYERGRPGYPPAAVAALVDRLGLAPGVAVVDLAAGGGKLTRQLLASGATVVALGPAAAMRAQLTLALPGVPVLAGTAEAVPLAAASLDAVAVGQAFHWFDGPRAVAELHRVLRPGGRVGLLWNVRDEALPWVAAITAIIDRHAGDAPRYRHGRWRAAFAAAAGFTPLRRRRFRHVHLLDRAALLDRVASISFVAALPDADRARVLAEVEQVVAGEPTLAGTGPVGLPYRTDLYWCARRPGPADDDRPGG
jgi:SAM-dependent methyltransferase